LQPPFLTYYWECAARRDRQSYEPGYDALCSWSQFFNGGLPADLADGNFACPRCGGQAYAALYVV
jgi:hypothetical protein